MLRNFFLVGPYRNFEIPYEFEIVFIINLKIKIYS